MLLWLLPLVAGAQQSSKIEILHADELTLQKGHGQEVRKLIGNVRMKQDNAILYCDSAYYYDQRNQVEAWGNVRINQADTLNLYGDYLYYDGNTKLALIEDNVRIKDKTMTLKTERLNYDVDKRTGYYTDSATIRSGKDVLTSRRGYYYGQTRDLYFRRDVKLVNPDYVMESDTLRYHTPTQVAYFYGPTTITAEDNFIYCENGWYNTATDVARFGENAYLRSGAQWLYSDSLYYERQRGYGRARGNVKIIDTAEVITITGSLAEHFEKQEVTYITGRALVEKPFDTDTFYLHADTLKAEFDSTGTHRIVRAYYGARTYSSEFQGRADSMIYNLADSVMEMFRFPVLWFDEYQVTSDHIKIFTKNNKISEAELTADAMIISPEDSLNYNQIKGKKMYAFFKDNRLSRVRVEGNGESIYYVSDDEGGGQIGVNKIVATNIIIDMDSNKVSNITFLTKPAGNMHPPGALSSAELRLKGFEWMPLLRPDSVEELFTKD